MALVKKVMVTGHSEVQPHRRLQKLVDSAAEAEKQAEAWLANGEADFVRLEERLFPGRDGKKPVPAKKEDAPASGDAEKAE